MKPKLESVFEFEGILFEFLNCWYYKLIHSLDWIVYQEKNKQKQKKSQENRH